MPLKSLRFCANLNFLFCEGSANILQKFRLAKQAGFAAVEMGFPSDFNEEQVVSAARENDLKIILLNISLGELRLSQFV